MNSDDFLLLSGIQHYFFCHRQWGLIHIEGKWGENFFTISGEQLHENAHEGGVEKRGNLIITRALYVFSNTMKVSGQCDVVEFHADLNGVPLKNYKGKWLPVPVEYKRGKGTSIEADSYQLCAEAMCLEEMLLCSIPRGYLYYGEPRRRTEVLFTEDLRGKVKECFMEMHKFFDRSFTPRPKKKRACNSCSLKDVCLPSLESTPKVKDYISEYIKT